MHSLWLFPSTSWDKFAELANISERRTYKLIEGSRGLPDYPTAQSGLHSGMMITQYTAASVVSQNKQLCSPSSVDSIVSSKGQEDHVAWQLMELQKHTVSLKMYTRCWQLNLWLLARHWNSDVH